MHLAMIDTANFSFVAAGSTADHAKRVLAAAWRKHKRQTGATLSVDEILEDCNVVEIVMGDAVRDGSPIVRGIA